METAGKNLAAIGVRLFRCAAGNMSKTIPCLVLIHGERVPAIYVDDVRARKHAALINGVLFHGTVRVGRRYEQPKVKRPRKSKKKG